MKRIVFLSVLVILGFIHSPETYSQGLNKVSVETAKAVAIKYLLNTEVKYAGFSEKDIILSLVETKTINGNSIYYVFNISREDGYIIISADLNSPPVLCYVPQGSFISDPEKRPPAFNDWLNAFTLQIDSSVRNPVKNAKWQDLWNSFISKGKLDSEILRLNLNTQWEQGEPFNIYTPSGCPTGCVATAMGQILNYYQWPLTGVGNHSYVDPANPNPAKLPCLDTHNDPSYGEQSFSQYGLTRSYNYSIMDDGNENAYLEISKLLYHCGVSVDMDYATGGSWANTFVVEDALKTYWDYNDAADFVNKDPDYSDEEWEDLLIEQIQNEWPVQYRGAGPDNCGGHSWICSGYKVTATGKEFWFNWGGTATNGYYAIGSFDQFSYHNGAVINIYPSDQPNLTITEASVPQSTVYIGTPFTASFSIENNGTREAVNSIAACYLSTDPNLNSGDRYLGSLNIPSLTIDQSSDDNEFVDLVISDFATGPCYILFEADTAHVVHELDEHPAIGTVPENIFPVAITIEGGLPVYDYQSKDDGNWNDLDTWQQSSDNGNTWDDATSIPTNLGGNITIRNGHMVTVSTVLSVDEVVINSGGQVIVNNVLTLVDGPEDDLAVNGTGTIELTGTGEITGTGNLIFNDESTYIHNRNGGSIPTATWAVNSNCNITGITTTVPLVSTFTQTFGNFTWDCTGQSASSIDLKGKLSDIAGTFYLKSTGASGSNLRLGNSDAGNLSVGNFVQTGGFFILNGENNSITREMTVLEDFTLTGGTIYIAPFNTSGGGIINVTGNFTSSGFFNYSEYNTTGPITVIVTGNCSITGGVFNMSRTNVIGMLNVSGNFSHTGGEITCGTSSTGSIVFNGSYNGSTGMQTYTSGGAIMSNSKINFTVNNGAYLQMGTGSTVSSIIGGGTFTLASDGTLGITSPDGIMAAGTASGNIRTLVRQYNTGANYIYNGAVNQAVGSGLPGTVNSLTVANTGSSGSNTVTLAQITQVNGNLSVNSGVLDLGSFTCDRSSLGGILTVDNGAGLKIGGTNSMPAEYSVHELGSTSTIYYTGTTGGQTISPEVYGNLSLENTSGTNTLNGNITVDGTLTTKAGGEGKIGSESFLNAATVVNNGILTLDPMGQATITTLTNNGTINLNSGESGISSLLINNDTYGGTGTFDIQLYLTGGGGDNAWKWHYISSPVQNTPITVFNGNTANLASYDESLVITSQNQGWVAADGFIYENPNGLTRPGFTELHLGKGYAYYFGIEQWYTITGSINAGEVNQMLSYDAGYSGNPDIIGFNLVGNPFTCTLDWSVVDDNLGTNISKAIYTTRDYTLYPAWVDGDATDGGTPYIVPMQAFFVEAKASLQSLNLPVSAKSHQYDDYYNPDIRDRFKGDEEAKTSVRLLLEGGGHSRDAVVRLDEKAQLTFDNSFDAYSLGKGLGPMSIWTNIKGTSYAINRIPYPETSIDIPVGMHAENAGTFTLRSNELNGLENYNVTLKDKMTNTVIDLKKGNKLAFSTSAGEFEDRFVLTISNLATGTEVITLPENSFNIYALNGILNIIPLSDEWNGKSGSVRIADFMGKSITDNRNIEFWKNSLIELPVNRAKGIYFVEIRSGVMRYVGKVMIR